MTHLDDELAAAFERQGRAVAEAVGVPLVGCDYRIFGEHCGYLVAEAYRIGRVNAQPPQSKKRDSAATIAELAKDLRAAIIEHQLNWGAPIVFGDFSRPNCIPSEFLEDLVSLERLYSWEHGVASRDQKAARGMRRFVGDTMASVFQLRFGVEAGYTIDPEDNSVRGPFVRFVRAILRAADVELTDSAIAAAVRRSKPPEKRGKRQRA